MSPSPGGVIEVESTAAEQTMSQQLPDGGEAAAPALVVTPTKKRKRTTVGSAPESEGIKVLRGKGQKKSQGDECPKAKRSDKAMSQLAEHADMVKCVYHFGTCIPLWPQYQKVVAGSNFLKVSPYEQWLIDYVGGQRKQMKRDLKAKEVETSIKWARSSNAMLCKKVLLEFKKVIAEAKANYVKKSKK